MSARRNLILNVVIQTVGAASSFVVIVALARLAGPAVQGQYAVYKSLIDVQVALLTLGLPSGFIYVINKSLVPGSVLARWSARGIPAFTVVGGGITVGYLATRGPRHAGPAAVRQPLDGRCRCDHLLRTDARHRPDPDGRSRFRVALGLAVDLAPVARSAAWGWTVGPR